MTWGIIYLSLIHISLKEKIVDLAKKDAQDNVYMGNAFMNLRKAEVSKVAPDRAALIGKFSQSMNSGNMSAMKEVEEADKKWLCMLFGICLLYTSRCV